MMHARLSTQCMLIVVALMVTSACGGGGGGGGSSSPIPTPPTETTASDFERGIFSAASTYANLCALPRGSGFDDTQGTTTDENNWLRAWSHDLYLWYNEIIDQDPTAFETPDYFDLMKTTAVTPSGNPKDKFHFTYPTEEWQQLSERGVAIGYGLDLVLKQSSPPREILLGLVDVGSPAANAGLTRGVRVLTVDGIDAINGDSEADVDGLNNALFPDAIGETHEFEVEDFDGKNRRMVSLTSAQLNRNPVPLKALGLPSSGFEEVAYLLFNRHIATAEAGLIDAMQQFSDAGVTQLILDLRYNGGGFLDIANELAFMIAGPSATQNVFFTQIEFNDQHPTQNPVTSEALQPEPFLTTAQGFSAPSGTPLPSLNLSRVFVLSSATTCSASEAIINGLRGIGLEVVLIGQATCGKPYGTYPADNCGTTYFSTQFRGVNNLGFGDYADGFIPDPSPSEPFEVIGCAVEDDFSRALGDPEEAMLATALNYIESNTCGSAGLRISQTSKTNRSAEKKIHLDAPPRPQLKPRYLPGMIK